MLQIEVSREREAFPIALRRLGQPAFVELEIAEAMEDVREWGEIPSLAVALGRSIEEGSRMIRTTGVGMHDSEAVLRGRDPALHPELREKLEAFRR